MFIAEVRNRHLFDEVLPYNRYLLLRCEKLTLVGHLAISLLGPLNFSTRFVEQVQLRRNRESKNFHICKIRQWHHVNDISLVKAKPM